MPNIGKRKSSRRRPAQRPSDQTDLVRRKVHDLANSLEAVSLAQHFIPRRPKVRGALEQIAAGLVEARKALHQMDAELRSAPKARRHAAAGR